MAKRKRHERAKRYAETHPEHTVSVEIMCMALARFHTSERWQEIGVVGRWFAEWVSAWEFIARKARFDLGGWSVRGNTITLSDPRDTRNFAVGMALDYTTCTPTLQDIYKRPYRVTAIDESQSTITVGWDEP